MDALEFLRERKRMCNLCKHCEGCPLERAGCGLGTSASDEEYEKLIATVEQWSKEHPRNTRQTELLKMFPEAHVSANGSLCLCPASVSAAYRDENGICKGRRLKCTDCCKEFWGQEVE